MADEIIADLQPCQLALTPDMHLGRRRFRPIQTPNVYIDGFWTVVLPKCNLRSAVFAKFATAPPRRCVVPGLPSGVAETGNRKRRERKHDGSGRALTQAAMTVTGFDRRRGGLEPQRSAQTAACVRFSLGNPGTHALNDSCDWQSGLRPRPDRPVSRYLQGCRSRWRQSSAESDA